MTNEHAIFNIELGKEDVEKINWIRERFDFDMKTNYEVLRFVLNTYYYIEKEKMDMLETD